MAKKRKKVSKNNTGGVENESSVRGDSTLMATSKYLNHTQLKNETESLSLLNSKVKRNGLMSVKTSKLLDNLIEEESSSESDHR